MRVLPALLCLFTAGCVQALTTADFNSLHDAQQLDLMIYGQATGPERAFARAAFCANDAVLRRVGQPSVDSKGVIVCQAARP